MSSPFKLKFSEDIFNYKYRHQGAETWDQLSKTLVGEVCSRLNKHTQTEIAQAISEMKFIPGGRYLYYAGRARKFYNNCFSRDTRFVTDVGIQSFKDFPDQQTVNVLCPATNTFVPATVRYFGKQKLYDVVFENVRGKSTKQWWVRSTRNHRWILNTGEETDFLKIGDVVKPTGFIGEESLVGWVHGAVFADGNVHSLADGFAHQLRLCGKKAVHLKKILSCPRGVVRKITDSYPEFANGDPCLYLNSSVNFKELPPSDSSVSYIASFIRGWLAFDGHQGSSNLIHTINKEALEFLLENSVYAGLVVTGNIRVTEEDSNFGTRKPLYYVSYQEFTDFPGFKVVSVEDLGDTHSDVWCVEVPNYGCFTLEHGIATGNCYVLKTEEDTREDWARISWSAENCLMTGGGIGVDYSTYRPSGSIIYSTGGTASGPIPKMQMVNEIGRHVMQGSSRRSAMYASLNCHHEDVHAFLTAKNWNSMKVPGTNGLTIGDLKAADFNYPAPLDMTNISVNYDTQWLETYRKTGNPGTVFTKNVRQALETGEPGFSFNFFSQEQETGRNACTEITSADDSDVCNLGSINLARVETLDEFKSLVELATLFLLCGTLTAELPYEKVYRIREKNRRLGLGLMGVHEWLLRRGYRYEVTAELRRWLQHYRSRSNEAAKQWSNYLNISTPVATRAIAPTGTIGSLASTTTGIEPIYAVAYKRRYLRNGDKWHYQYVLDETANHLIKDLGVEPGAVETATDLATDYQRRIAFQADVQDYVDMAISSTINLPSWGSVTNNEGLVSEFSRVLASYAHRLRGFTCYPDGSRGGQPLTAVSYEEAKGNVGQEYVETPDICDITGKGGVCGV